MGSIRPLRSAELPVVLVQGFGCHPRVLGPLSRRIRSSLGRTTLCLTPGLGIGDVRDTGMDLLEAIEAATSRLGFERVDVVAHSMGGLVAAYMMKCLDHGRRVRRVVALGTPFGGAAGARLVSLLGPLGGALAQIAPGSRLLRLLGSAPVPPGSALISVSGSRDQLVPAAAARIAPAPGQHHLDAGPCGHLQLLFGARGFVRIEQALAAPGLEAPANGPERLQPEASSRQVAQSFSAARAEVATAATSSAGSKGFAMCIWKPAASSRTRSSVVA